MEGLVIKTNAGKFAVKNGENEFLCTAKGVLKLKKMSILTGDRVDFDEKLNVINTVLKRDNFLIRPSIANIGLINIVISNPPAPDLLLVDKVICAARMKGIEFFITVNKCDLKNDLLNGIIKSYSKICKIFIVSAVTGENIDKLKEFIKGRLVCFAGQSAVGKTSLINKIMNLNNKTGEVSLKTERGRHTTTVTEIISKDGYFIADTPGFSVISNDIETEKLAELYFMNETKSVCRFRGCLHDSEPDCSVKELVGSLIDDSRYRRYLIILDELKKRRKKYD